MRREISSTWAARLPQAVTAVFFLFLLGSEVVQSGLSLGVASGACWGLAIIAVFELMTGGLRVILEPDVLTYREWYGLFSGPIVIRKQDVIRVERMDWLGIKLPIAVVFTRDPAHLSIKIRMGGFSTADANLIVGWLENSAAPHTT